MKYNNRQNQEVANYKKHKGPLMRFFIKIKENGKQLGLKRIQSKHDIVHTNELISLIQKSINIKSTSFIVRMINDQNKFRITHGWSLSHYGIKSGLQLQVQLVKVTKSQMLRQQNNQNQNFGEVLFNKKEMDNIIQQDQQQAEKALQIEHLVYKKYDQLLKLIQKNDTDGYLRQVNLANPTLGNCQNQFYKKQLLNIQNQLGTNGWAAIHCAVFVGNIQIIQFLIQIGVDINIKSSDEWLPIQLAIKQQQTNIFDILIAQPSLNINICTGQGLPLNMAVQSLNKQIITKLLIKDINFSARDHKGRNVYDVLSSQPNKQILELLQKEQRRQSISNVTLQKSIMYHALISSYRGEVICIRTPPRKDKQYYLFINPYEGVIKVYEDISHYSQYPKQILPMSLIKKFKQLPKSQKSWYMKNDLFYFVVGSPKSKYVFGCNFQTTVKKWISVYEASNDHFNTYKDSIKQFQRNDSVIMDRIQQQKPVQIPRKLNKSNKDELISLFTSKSTQRTEESPCRGVIVNFQRQSPEKKQNKKDESKKAQILPQIKQHQKQDKKQQQKQQQQSNDQNQTKIPPQVQLKTPQIHTQNIQVKPTEQIQNKNGLKFIDFKIIKVLGEGSFGTVYLATDLRNPQRKKYYALKCFKKKKLVLNKQIKYTIGQLSILKQLSHPFIVNLHFTFQTPNYVYLGLDYCPNRDLSHHLMNQVNFPEKQAAIYTAQILLALEYLHQKNIIYRDLKPENIMLDQQGHVKLVDFGLSKQGQEREFVAKSFCGSPAYLSPEMLIKKGVGKQSDFYCLGAVLYQMLTGQPPFFSDDLTTLYNNISKSKLTFPKSISYQAKNLLTGLLERNPQQRLGYKGCYEIKQHPYFKDISWESLMKKLVKAPIRQQVQVENQQDSLTIQNIHKDFDYSAQNYRINRFLNFSFIRQANNQN